MGKFAKYRIHFSIARKTGLLKAHSDHIRIDQVEEYKEVFGCGDGYPHTGTGDMYWHADPPTSEENSRRLAHDWLKELGRVYPDKARAILRMLNEDSTD